MSASYHSYHVTSRVLVRCSNCPTTWFKSKYTIKEWQGRCRSCAMKYVAAEPAYKAMKAAIARKQVLQQGGITNAVHITSERVSGAKNVNWKHTRRGADTPRWKGGVYPQTKTVRNSLKYQEWRTAVFKRDGYTCQICHARGGRLHGDHYPVPFCELFRQMLETVGMERFTEYAPLWDLNCGRTLCVKCHHQHGWRGSHIEESRAIN